MFTIRKKFRFEAAHRLSSSYSKECQRIHGHSYVVEVFVSSSMLNDDSMVIDFKKLSKAVDPLIARWDHEVLIHDADPEPGPKTSVLVSFNPTAELMALYLHDRIRGLLNLMPNSLRVRVHETENGWAEYKG